MLWGWERRRIRQWGRGRMGDGGWGSGEGGVGFGFLVGFISCGAFGVFGTVCFVYHERYCLYESPIAVEKAKFKR